MMTQTYGEGWALPHVRRVLRLAPSTEALLLREADFLDFLGAIGFARAFARRLSL
jgi:hypothetical protein